MPPVPRISSTRQPASSDPMGRSAIRVHCDAAAPASYALLRVEVVDEPPELAGLDRLLPALELVARAPDEEDREAARPDAVEVAQGERVEALGDVDDDHVAAGGGGGARGAGGGGGGGGGGAGAGGRRGGGARPAPRPPRAAAAARPGRGRPAGGV